jgi:D-inositol-3-phosphate glycosyltransferase
MRKVLKVSIIEPVGGHGGMDYYDFGLCAGLANANIDVVLHTCDETDVVDDFGFSVKHTYAGIYGRAASWRRGVTYVVSSVIALASSVAQRRKIVHFHFFHVGILSLMNVVLARIFFRKVVITAHDVESFVAALETPFMSRLAYRLSHKVVAHNKSSHDELLRCLSVPAEKIAVIPSGNYLHVAERVLEKETAKAQLGLPENSKVLLFFGQIKAVKRLDLLLHAMPEVIRQFPEVVLLIAGKPWKTDFAVYEKIINDLSITDHCINHIKFIHDDDLPSYFGCADLVVLPYDRIYQSAVVLMAMSYGSAVLVSDLPSMTELIEHNVNGFVFSSEDIQSLTEALVTILADSDLCADVAMRGLKCMISDFSWDRIGLETSKVYDNVLG